MCGIAGIVNLDQLKPISSNALRRMVSIQQHRGPDETGAYIGDNIGLAHSRLSIIDLSEGTQPIHNEDKSLWIIYNGEVFNYPELRQELVSRGHKFYTTSDTEVILHLYEEKGINCLNELNGQFAFAIWNSNNKTLFLARDRVGILPLFYTIQNQRLYFASEVKAIFSNEEVPRALDLESLDQIFTFWATLPGKTVFDNIKELPPAHYMLISQNGITTKKYWDMNCKGATEVVQREIKPGLPNVKCSPVTGAALWYGDPYDGTVPMGKKSGWVEGTFTVKEHSEYNGAKQRCWRGPGRTW